MAEGQVSPNVARLVERPKQSRPEMRTWTQDQIGALLQAVESDWRAAAWMLTTNGLRRGEVLGLCWSDIDLDARTLTIRQARNSVAGEVVEGEPKTANIMILRRVPLPVVSAWHGRAFTAFTLAHHGHSQDDALAAAVETLARTFVQRVR